MNSHPKLNILFFSLFLCSCQTEKTIPEKLKLQLAYEIIPEDFDRDLYYVKWIDTLGKSEGYLPGKFLRRPKEVWCVITNNKNDTLGYYTGSSLAQSFAYFQSQDSIVNLNFMIGLNMFSDKFENSSLGKKYWEANRLRIDFEKIQVNIKSGLRKRAEVELKEK